VTTIIPDFLPADHPLAQYPMVPRWITIHDTGNPQPGANAAMHGRYMRSQAAILNEVSWHFTVDDHEIRQHLPLDRNGWHAGDGLNGPGNRQSIGIEICENADGDRAAAEANAAKLVAHLIKTVPSLLPFPECVVQHNHWSGKNCPRVLRGRPGGWDGFLAMVERYLKESPFPDVPADAWYAQDVADLYKFGIIHGDPDGKFNPDRPATRAEVAKMIRLAIRYITGK